MCMEYALLQKNAVHNLTTWKSAYGGNANKANKTNYYISLLHYQLTLYIVMFKKSLYLKCVFYFTIICGLGCRSMGRLGRGGLFTTANNGNLKKKFYMPIINVSLFAISGNYHEHRQVTLFLTKLDSFILQRYGKFTKQYLNLIIISCICTKC